MVQIQSSTANQEQCSTQESLLDSLDSCSGQPTSGIFSFIFWAFSSFQATQQERDSGAAAGVKPDCTDSSGAAREDSQVRVLSGLQQNKHQKHEVFLLFAVPQGTYFYTFELSPARICQSQGCLQHRAKQVYQQLRTAL